MARIMALDLGSVRTGVAFSDPTRTIATPAARPVTGATATGFLEEVRDLVSAQEVERIIVGIPRSLDGTRGPMARWAEGVRRTLAAKLAIPVEPWDERFSTAEAGRRLREQGSSSRTMRDRLDSAAAAVILEEYLEAARSGAVKSARRS